MRNKISRNKYLKNHDIYPDSYSKFNQSLKKNFRKREDLLSQTRIQEATGQHPQTLKKYLDAAVELGDVRQCQAYFLGCSPYELILANFGFGDILFCPSCNKEVLLPSEGNELACNCGIHYIKRDTAKWIYQPQMKYLGDRSWKIESFSCPGEFYVVRPFEGFCSCSHNSYHNAYCKHLKQVTEVIANIVLDRAISDRNFKANGELIVFSAVLRRWFDSRKKVKILTYRALGNEIEKSGLRISKVILTKIVTEFEEKQVLKRTNIKSKTFISVNQGVLMQFFELDKAYIDGYTQSFKVELPKNKASFLKLDSVEYPGINLPSCDFTLLAEINYYFPKPTPVRLDLQDAQSHMTLFSLAVRLNGEDVTSVNIKPEIQENRSWIPKVELYCQDDKKEWHLADHYLSNRKIFSPIIRMDKSKYGIYEVESFSEAGKFYKVDITKKQCTCLNYLFNHNYCKHLQAVETAEHNVSKLTRAYE
jgi:hypothetical protein